MPKIMSCLHATHAAEKIVDNVVKDSALIQILDQLRFCFSSQEVTKFRR